MKIIICLLSGVLSAFLISCAIVRPLDNQPRTPANAEAESERGLAAGQNPESKASLAEVKASPQYISCMNNSNNEFLCLSFATPLPESSPMFTETISCTRSGLSYQPNFKNLSDLGDACRSFGGIESSQNIVSTCHMSWKGHIAEVRRHCLRGGSIAH